MAKIRRKRTWRIDPDGDVEEEVGEGGSGLVIGHDVPVEDGENLVLFGLEEDLAEVPIFFNKHSCSGDGIHFQTRGDTSYIGKHIVSHDLDFVLHGGRQIL